MTVYHTKGYGGGRTSRKLHKTYLHFICHTNKQDLSMFSKKGPSDQLAVCSTEQKKEKLNAASPTLDLILCTVKRPPNDLRSVIGL